MNAQKLLPALLALPLLLGACSSVTQTTAQLPKTPPAVRVADRDTAWGMRPSYDPKGQTFVVLFRGPAVHQEAKSDDGALHNGTATVDILVNRDGTVADAKISASSGDEMVDHAALRIYWNSRYTLQLGHDDPAPYVVSQTVVLKSVTLSAWRRSVDYGGPNHSSLPIYTGQNLNGLPDNVNGFPR